MSLLRDSKAEGRPSLPLMSDNNRHINFKLMRDHILSLQDADTSRTGKKYWRSLEELAESPVFRDLVSREFPRQADGWHDAVERRTFIKLMGASLALAGLSGCVFQPPEKIIPNVVPPVDRPPGTSLYYATAAPLFGPATPILVRSFDGRPIKIEGNPDHPNSRPIDFPAQDPYRDPRGSSATDIFTQASILTLYDPDRSQTVTYREDIRTWTDFVGAMRSALDEQRSKQGAGIRFLTETIFSPTLAAQIRELLATFPRAKWHQYTPANRDYVRAGAIAAFGQPVTLLYSFDLAQRILSLDCDFLSPAYPGSLRYSRAFMARRRVSEANKEMNRLYVIETTPSNTGAMADHAWRVKPAEFDAIARTIAANGAGPANLSWIGPLVDDLQQHRGASIVIAGDNQQPEIHVLAHQMNNALDNVGKTVFYAQPIEANSVDHTESLRELIGDMDAGRVELLVILGGNPVYNTPTDLKLDFERLEKAKLRVHLSEYKDETSQLCHWHVPAAHYLEQWGDTRAYDGTVTIMQPLIEPLYDGKSAYELLAVFSDQYDRKPYDLVKSFWQAQRTGGSNQAQATEPASTQRNQTAQSPVPTTPPSPSPSQDFEMWWRKAVHDGFIENSAFAALNVSLQAAANPTGNSSVEPAAAVGIEVVFRTDPSIYDGRFANNGWLQELPKPLTKVTWDNVGVVSPKTAQELAGENPIRHGVVGREHYVRTVELVSQQGYIKQVPLWILPGQPDGVITIHLGYGRRLAGRVGSGTEAEPVGFDAYRIRTSDEPWLSRSIAVRPSNTTYLLATTQMHFNLEDLNFSREERDIARSDILEHYLKGAEQQEEHVHPSLYPEYDYQDQGENARNYAWGMAIDLNNCIGCNACMVACQAENKIPIVGKNEVVRSREMHWIRVDTYFSGGVDPAHPAGTNFMPVPCMHCEKAPCEPVCPVHATVHSAEGLNDMVYNRCVGTKYCSNNCPYKVRRFNFFLYQDWETPTYQLMRNPDVSVRSRGVMEKCTYCVQRIQMGKIQAELEERRLRDGEIVTACQAVCPTDAIVFGDINDPNSRVTKLKANDRNYSLLGELNTQPRTTYLTQLKNPNWRIRSLS